MGHKNKKSLIRQVQEKLLSKMAAGDSRHLDKAAGITTGKIYSYGTLNAYLQQCCDFVKYAKTEHGAKTLDGCRPFVNEYLQHSIDGGKSSYTLKLQSSALAKLYDCRSSDFIPTPSRSRENITRSRGVAVRDAHFSESRNKALVDFCKSTGLTRHELAALTGDCLRQDEHGRYYIRVKSGKGGKSRWAPVMGNKSQIQNVVTLCGKAGDSKVFSKIHNGADIHHYRGCYAERVYKAHARPVSSLQSSERYVCRGSLKGTVYDRAALRATSQALGHNRISVVASHYLYRL
jgi:site-specific recombinase XerC